MHSVNYTINQEQYHQSLCGIFLPLILNKAIENWQGVKEGGSRSKGTRKAFEQLHVPGMITLKMHENIPPPT
jgi:hypothetical protein